MAHTVFKRHGPARRYERLPICSHARLAKKLAKTNEEIEPFSLYSINSRRETGHTVFVISVFT